MTAHGRGSPAAAPATNIQKGECDFMALLPNDFSDEPENNTGEAARQPRTRLAKFLAKIAGVYGEQIEPKTEVERYLDKIAVSGGGSGGGVYVVSVAFDEAEGRPFLDKTFKEIMEAISAGKTAYMYVRFENRESSQVTVDTHFAPLYTAHRVVDNQKVGTYTETYVVRATFVDLSVSTEPLTVTFASVQEDGVLIATV